MTNTTAIIMNLIKNDDAIIAQSRGFYAEGDFDDICIAEMIFSCAMLQGKI